MGQRKDGNSGSWSRAQIVLVAAGVIAFIFAAACMLDSRPSGLVAALVTLGALCFVLAALGDRILKFRIPGILSAEFAPPAKPEGATVALEDSVKLEVQRERAEVEHEPAVPLETLRDEIDLPRVERNEEQEPQDLGVEKESHDD